VPVRLFTTNTVAYDLAYARGDTPFTQWARKRGLKQVHKGYGMLVEQAAAAFALWRGVRPDTAPVLEALRSL
jgi:shikimate dehydrogenase